MAIRFAAASGLALAAALLIAPAARAQSFFFAPYEMSPRQIVGMLQDDGYQLRGPMLRRGDVYVCDVVSLTGRPARLIVDARSGRVVERYARGPRWRDDGTPGLRPPRDVGEDAPTRLDEGDNQRRMALGDWDSPPPSHDDSVAPPSDAPKPKKHVAKKHVAVARAPDAAAPDAGVSPEKPAANAAPAPEASPPAAAAATPAPETKKPETAKVEPAPKASPEPRPAKSDDDKRAAAEPKPATAAPLPAAKPEPAKKKLNDLPVGTLD